jgi:hypothetical protein
MTAMYKFFVRSIGDNDAFAVKNALQKPTTLNRLADSFGPPDNKEFGQKDDEGRSIERWWWGPIVFSAAAPDAEVTGHGLSIKWIESNK